MNNQKELQKLQVETWPVDRLIPYARNPRKNDEVVERMASAIREFGFRIPIVAKSDGSVVDGHLRLKAAQKLGLKEVPVALADELTDAQVKAFRLLANKSVNWAEWDNELLRLELDELRLLDIDLELTGFANEEIDNLLAPINTGIDINADDCPEVQEIPVTQEGDIWILGEHRLLCGDCTDVTNVALLMNGEKADMVFTDPPYNVNYSDKNVMLNSIGHGTRIQTPIIGDKATSDDEAAEKLWKPAFQNMRDNAQPHCSIYCTMPQGSAHIMLMVAASASWQVKHELIWMKNHMVLGRCDYNYKHEPILYGWAEKHKFYGKGDFNQSVWEVSKPQKSDLHPTMKPVALIINAIKNSSKSNDIVLDVFGGSGSTLIACEQTSRKCRMMELSPHYCDVVISRWQKLTGKPAVHEATGKTFEEISSERNKV